MNTSRRALDSRRVTGTLIVTIGALIGGLLPAAWAQTAPAALIKFLSPTSFAGEMPVLTDDPNGGLNDTYRLSAWVAGAPEGALVEFELVPPADSLGTRPMTIGAGQPVAGDTYEYQWDIAEGPTGVVEGRYTLKVTLYDSASEELSADAVTVNIVHGPTAQKADGGKEPVDITYPVSGGPLGQYTASSGKTNSVLDASRRGTASVKAWFTTSLPGTSPVWKLCNPGESATDFPDGVRCTYPVDDPATKETNEAVDPARVTAVGLALAGEGGSADVVRVFPYAQEPSGLRYDLFARLATTGALDKDVPGSLTRQKDPNTGFGCSDWVRVKVVDQAGRTIAGANLDAHASGPSDQLRFHNSYLSATQSPGLQPPDQGHSSFPEAATKCIRHHDTVMKQGEHGLGGQPDRKHVETVIGTRDNGTFDLALETDQAGATQLTVWVDEADDDKFCSGEPSTGMAFGWGIDPPSSNPEQPADCPVTPGPDPIDEEPFDGSRTAAIELSKSAVRKGRSMMIVGSIDAADALCEAAQTLKLQAKKPGVRRFRTISSGVTNSFGLLGFRVTIEATKLYRVVAPAAGECALARSTIRKVRAI